MKAEISFLWMYCPNKACGRLIVKGLSARRTYSGGIPQETKLDEWIILPRRATRYINPLVPDQYAEDYRQAAAILDASPKASAGLSRRILADLLQDYGKYTQFKLSARIDSFINDRTNPTPLRQYLHYLREMADFGVHTQKDSTTGVIIDVELEEAKWCLDVLDRLFDYYIIGPIHDKQMLAGMDEKLAQAGRKPIMPLSDEEQYGQEKPDPENPQGPRDSSSDPQRLLRESKESLRTRRSPERGEGIKRPPGEGLAQTEHVHRLDPSISEHTHSGSPEDA
jgi:hypothetical protein